MATHVTFETLDGFTRTEMRGIDPKNPPRTLLLPLLLQDRHGNLCHPDAPTTVDPEHEFIARQYDLQEDNDGYLLYRERPTCLYGPHQVRQVAEALAGSAAS